MFTYPVMSAGAAAFYNEEWVVMSAKLSGGVTEKLFYWKSTSTAVTTIATGVMPDISALACDGRYIITPSITSAQHMAFLGWDGATGFTALHDFDAGDTVNAGAGLHTSPEIAGRILVPYTDADKVSVLTYTAGAPTALTQTQELAAGSTLKGGPYDLRSGIEKFTPTHGTTRFVGGTAFTNNDTAKMFDLTGSTLSVIATGPSSTSQFTGFFPQRAGYDRDAHIAYEITTGGAIYAWVMDADTPSIGSRLTLTGGGTPAAITGCNGFVIVALTSGLIKSYSRAGSALTEVSSYDSGALIGAGNAQLVVSPYTNWVYPHYTADTGTRRVLEVSESGIITALGQMPQMTNSSGTHTGNWSFIPAALPSLP